MLDRGVAHREWANRRDEEKFDNVAEFIADAKRWMDESHEIECPWKSLAFEPDGEEILAVPKTDWAYCGANLQPPRLTHWSFQQAAGYSGMPADPLRKLSPKLASDCLNELLTKERPDGTANLLVRLNGSTEIRALTTDRYIRAWDHDLIPFYEFLQENGWMVPPSWPSPNCPESRKKITQTHETFEGSLVKVGDIRGPNGLNRSDRNSFAFFIQPNSYIKTPDGKTMWRGLVIQNSEVRECSFKANGFLFDQVCGNHNLFGAQELFEANFRHTGDVQAKMIAAFQSLQAFSHRSMQEEQDTINRASTLLLADKSEDVAEKLLSKRSLALTLKQAKDAVTLANTGKYGDPRSAWAVSQALTQLSQSQAYTGARVDLDRQAARVLAAF